MNSFDKTLHERYKERIKEPSKNGICYPTVEKLLYLQLMGYSSQQIIKACTEADEQLNIKAANIKPALDKAKRILDRQAKAGIATIPYYANDYPCNLGHLGCDAPPLIHVSGNVKLLNRDDNVAIIGARAADAGGTNASWQ